MTTNFERTFAGRDRMDVYEAWVQLNTAIMELGIPNRMTQQKLRALDAILDADSACWTKIREDKQ